MAIWKHGPIMFFPVDFSTYSDPINMYKAACKFREIIDEGFWNKNDYEFLFHEKL